MLFDGDKNFKRDGVLSAQLFDRSAVHFDQVFGELRFESLVKHGFVRFGGGRISDFQIQKFASFFGFDREHDGALRGGVGDGKA